STRAAGARRASPSPPRSAALQRINRETRATLGPGQRRLDLTRCGLHDETVASSAVFTERSSTTVAAPPKDGPAARVARPWLCVPATSELALFRSLQRSMPAPSVLPNAARRELNRLQARLEALYHLEPGPNIVPFVQV